MAGDGKLGCLYAGICFLFPYVGYFMWLTIKSERPVMAKDAFKWSMWGTVFNGVVLLIAGLAAIFILLG